MPFAKQRSERQERDKSKKDAAAGKSNKAARGGPQGRAAAQRSAQQQLEPVDPVWLVKALAACLLAAVFCAWLTACLLFYQGDWQLVLHPSRTVAATPASVGLGYEPVRFDAGETGEPRLTGWWVPAAGGRYAGLTVLYLHGGSGSLADTVPMLKLLHGTGVNVFAIDYRGYGSSDASEHPNEARMAQDSSDALEYLTGTRHLGAGTILPYGVGLGGALAVHLADEHPELPVVIVEDPVAHPTAEAEETRPSKIVPVGLLFHERFDVVRQLAALKMPKLLIAGGPAVDRNKQQMKPMQELFQQAASPKIAVTLPASGYEDAYRAALERFLDQYVATSAPGVGAAKE